MRRVVGLRLWREPIDRRPQLGHDRGKLGRACGRLAAPERNGRRGSARVLDKHATGPDAQDAPRSVAEEEYIAGEALDREVLVDCPTTRPSGCMTTLYSAVSGIAPPPVIAVSRAPRRP
jgi:hypothetical protein